MLTCDHFTIAYWQALRGLMALSKKIIHERYKHKHLWNVSSFPYLVSNKCYLVINPRGPVIPLLPTQLSLPRINVLPILPPLSEWLHLLPRNSYIIVHQTHSGKLLSCNYNDIIQLPKNPPPLVHAQIRHWRTTTNWRHYSNHLHRLPNVQTNKPRKGKPRWQIGTDVLGWSTQRPRSQVGNICLILPKTEGTSHSSFISLHLARRKPH